MVASSVVGRPLVCYRRFNRCRIGRLEGRIQTNHDPQVSCHAPTTSKRRSNALYIWPCVCPCNPSHTTAHRTAPASAPSSQASIDSIFGLFLQPIKHSRPSGNGSSPSPHLTSAPSRGRPLINTSASRTQAAAVKDPILGFGTSATPAPTYTSSHCFAHNTCMS